MGENDKESKIDNSDLRLLMIAAFRYSLGRRTYMPSFVADLIMKNYHVFNEKDLERFIEEVNKKRDLGESCDIETWGELVYFCENKVTILK